MKKSIFNFSVLLCCLLSLNTVYSANNVKPDLIERVDMSSITVEKLANENMPMDLVLESIAPANPRNLNYKDLEVGNIWQCTIMSADNAKQRSDLGFKSAKLKFTKISENMMKVKYIELVVIDSDIESNLGRTMKIPLPREDYKSKNPSASKTFFTGNHMINAFVTSKPVDQDDQKIGDLILKERVNTTTEVISSVITCSKEKVLLQQKAVAPKSNRKKSKGTSSTK